MRKCNGCETAQGPFVLIKGILFCEQCKWKYVRKMYRSKSIEEQIKRQESRLKAIYKRIADSFFPI